MMVIESYNILADVSGICSELIVLLKKDPSYLKLDGCSLNSPIHSIVIEPQRIINSGF